MNLRAFYPYSAELYMPQLDTFHNQQLTMLPSDHSNPTPTELVGTGCCHECSCCAQIVRYLGNYGN